MRTKIFTDTTCDLAPERRAAHDIAALPLHVYLGNDEYLDGVNVVPQQLFDYAEKYKQLPKTAAIAPMDFKQAFQQALDEGYDELLYVGLSSKLSATFQNACMARDILADKGYDARRIHLIDSRQLSSGTAHLLLCGADVIEAGGTAQDAEDAIRRMIPRLSTNFIVDALQYLHMGGRCSSVSYMAGSILKLHPQINVIDGEMKAGEKYRGDIDQCIRRYTKRNVVNQLDKLSPERIFVTSSLPREKAEQLADEIRGLNYFKEVLVEFTGATISSHCGPNTIGYLTVLKD